METWPNSPFLSENYDAYSTQIHKTLNTAFLTWSLSVSYLLLRPLSMFPPAQDLQFSVLHSFEGKMMPSGPGRRCGYHRHSKQRRHLFQSLCSLGVPKGKTTIKDCNTFSMESFFPHGGPPCGKALPLYRRWASPGFPAVLLRDLGYMALWKPPGTSQAWEGGRGISSKSFCG